MIGASAQSQDFFCPEPSHVHFSVCIYGNTCSSGAGRVDSMFIRNDLPEFCADLITALPSFGTRRRDNWQAKKQQRGWQVFGTNWYRYKSSIQISFFLEKRDPFWYQFWWRLDHSNYITISYHSLHVDEFAHGSRKLKSQRAQTALRLESFKQKSVLRQEMLGLVNRNKFQLSVYIWHI